MVIWYSLVVSSKPEDCGCSENDSGADGTMRGSFVHRNYGFPSNCLFCAGLDDQKPAALNYMRHEPQPDNI